MGIRSGNGGFLHEEDKDLRLPLSGSPDVMPRTTLKVNKRNVEK